MRARRWSLEISLSEFAARIGGYSPSHVSRLEGSSKIARHLRIPIAKILEFDSFDALEKVTRQEVLEWISHRRANDAIPHNFIIDNSVLNPETPEEVWKSITWHRREIARLTQPFPVGGSIAR